MRWVALAILLLSSVAVARPGQNSVPYPQPKPPPIFSLLPGGTGAGVSQVNATGFCNQFAAEMTGNYFCRDGSGQRASDPIQLVIQGSPPLQADANCPNGPNCESVTGYRTSTAFSFFKSANTQSPTGDMFACALYRQDADNAAGTPLVAYDDAASNRRFQLEEGAGFIIPVVNGTNVTFLAPPPFGSTAFVCMSYKRNGAGAVNTLKTYINGALIDTQTTVADWGASTSAIGWSVGARSDAGGPFNGVIYAFVKSDKTPTDAKVAEMASALLPTVQGTRGEALTVSRTGTRSCCNAQGCSMLPANVTCAHDGLVDVSGGATNLALRSSEFDNAAWTKTNAVVTANSTIAPDGTLTADTVTGSVSSNSKLEINGYPSVTGTSVTAAVWIRTVSGSQAGFVSIWDGTGGSTLCTTSFTNTTTWQRVSCSGTIVSGHAASPIIYTGDGATTFGTIVIWGAQLSASSVALPYVPTAGTSASSTADTITVSTTGFPKAVGCLAASYVPSGETSAFHFLFNWQGTGRIALSHLNLTVQATVNDGSGETNVASGNLTWTAGQKYRVVMKWSGTTVTIYRDGVQLATNAAQHVPAAGTSMNATAQIGGESAGGNMLHGLMAIERISSDPDSCL